jgi:MYXO-CTERM domain-containing protein
VLSPGASVETLATGTLSFTTGSSFAYEVDSTVGLSTGADLQTVSGDLNLTGTVDLTLADLATGGPALAFAENTVFTLINYTGSWNSGTFTFDGNALADGGTFTAGLNTWIIDYDATTGGSNFSGEYLAGSFVNITAVPEPVAALLGGLGLLTLLRRRRSA